MLIAALPKVCPPTLVKNCPGNDFVVDAAERRLGSKAWIYRNNCVQIVPMAVRWRLGSSARSTGTKKAAPARKEERPRRLRRGLSLETVTRRESYFRFAL